MKETKLRVKERLERRVRHWYFTLLILFNILAMFIISVVIFWSVYPYKTIEFNDKEFPILNKEVKQGGSLRFMVDSCKYAALPATISRRYVNEIVFTVSSIHVNNPTGCSKRIVLMKTPEELPKGIYTIESRYTYQVNPIREISTTINTEKFIIK